ncbi:MAG: phage tail tape measure protein [Treponema sp.]|nr:phage tail tape measure protein [Treponema sp.]
MASRYEVSTTFALVDRASAALKSIGASGDAVSGRLNASLLKAQERVTAFGETAKAAGKMLIGMGVAAAGTGLVIATKQYADFDTALHGAGAAFSDVDSSAADFEERLYEIGLSARAVAAATEFDAKQTADAMATLARAGVDSSNAIALLPGVADLATAACVEMNEAVGMAVGGLNVMGMMSDNPEILAQNMKHLSDVMAYTADSANMSLTDVSEAITAGGAFFKTANNNLNMFSASLTALANNSIVGAEAGTHLRNIMTNLSAPTDKAAEALKSMGIATTDSSGNLLSLSNIVGQFNKAMVGMGDAERNANLYAIFGKQNIAAFNALLNTGANALEGYAATAANSTDAAMQKAEALRGSLLNKLNVLKSALTEKGFQFVDAFAGKGGNFITELTESISNFDVTPLVNGLTTALNVITKIVQTAWTFRGVIIAVVAAMTTWRLVTDAIVIAQKAHNVITTVATGAQIAYASVIKGSTAAQSALAFATTGTKIATAIFTIVMKGAAFATGLMSSAVGVLNTLFVATPIGWIVLGIMALIGVIVLCVKHWDSISAALKRVGDWFVWLGTSIANFAVEAWNSIINFFSGVGTRIAEFASSAWEAITGFFTNLYQRFMTFLFGENAPAVEEFIAQMFEKVGAFFAGLWEKITAFFGSVWEHTTAFFVTIGENIGTFFGGIWERTTTAFATATEGISSFFGGIWEKITGFFTGIGETLSGWVETIKGKLQPLFDWIHGLFNGVATMWQNVTSVFQAEGIVGVFKRIGSAILGWVLTPIEKMLRALDWIPGIGGTIGSWADKIADMRSGFEESASFESNQQPIAPISPAERAVNNYSREESKTTSNVNITLDDKLSANAYGSISPGVTLQKTSSGAF